MYDAFDGPEPVTVKSVKRLIIYGRPSWNVVMIADDGCVIGANFGDLATFEPVTDGHDAPNKC